MRRLSLFVALLMATLTSTAAARDIRLYGAPVRQGDFVAGTVRFVEGRSVAIDMGYADGVTSGHRFRVYRRVGRDYRISGVAIVGLVQRRQSVVTARTAVPIRAGDAVVIAASELTIWTEPRDRLYDERLRRRVALPRRFGFDTRQTAIDEIDLLEARRGNRLKLLEWTRQVTAARPGTTVLWDLTNLKTRRQDFIRESPTRLLPMPRTNPRRRRAWPRRIPKPRPGSLAWCRSREVCRCTWDAAILASSSLRD